MPLDKDLPQIDDRNRLRRESSLPQLEIDSELQRLKAVRLMAGREGFMARMGAWTLMRRRLRQERRNSRTQGA